MANVRFDGINEDLTAPGTPWIYYGVGTLHDLPRPDLLDYRDPTLAHELPI